MIYIFGSGSFAQEIKFHLRNKYFGGIKFISEQEEDELFSIKEKEIHLWKDHFFLAIGDSQIREQIYFKFKQIHNLHFDNFGRDDICDGSIGEGSLILPGSIFTTNISVGIGCVVNIACNISHDVEVDNFVTINPGCNIAGKVKIGHHAYLGIGSTIIQGVEICHHAVIGAGAVVVEDIESPGTYVGCPARRIK